MARILLEIMVYCIELDVGGDSYCDVYIKVKLINYG